MKIPTADPGTGAVLTPFCKTTGLYFDPSHEPEDFKYLFDKEIDESIIKQLNGIFVKPKFDTMDEYFDYHVGAYDIASKLSSNMNANNIHIIDISRPVTEITEVAEDNNIDDIIDDE